MILALNFSTLGGIIELEAQIELSANKGDHQYEYRTRSN
jgi:hypothetical protein